MFNLAVFSLMTNTKNKNFWIQFLKKVDKSDHFSHLRVILIALLSWVIEFEFQKHQTTVSGTPRGQQKKNLIHHHIKKITKNLPTLPLQLVIFFFSSLQISPSPPCDFFLKVVIFF